MITRSRAIHLPLFFVFCSFGDISINACIFSGTSVTLQILDSVSLENDLIKEEGLKIGLGIEYMFKRDLKDNMGEIKFENIVYGTIKILLSSKTNPIYAKAKVGYSTLKGDDDYEGDTLFPVIYKGGMLYGFGGEVYLNQSNFVELMFLNYKSGAFVNNVDLDIKHTHLNVGVGFTF